MNSIRYSLVKLLGVSLIFLASTASIIVLLIFFFEIYTKYYQAEINPKIPLFETNYYGEKLSYDPYKKFTIQHLHPYFFFSLPWKKTDILNANNAYVNLGEDGFRINNFSAKRKFLLLGGSTAFGYLSSSDQMTIASLLSKRLNTKIINRNSPGWNSHQELIALLKYDGPYRASISFSTANDISIFCGDRLYHESYPDQVESFQKLSSFFNDIRSEPLDNHKTSKVKSWISSLMPGTYSLFHKYFNVNKNFEGSHENKNYCDGINGIELIANTILKNQKKMQLVSNSRGAKHFLIIQPWYPLHMNADIHDKKIFGEQIKFRRAVISRLLDDSFCKNSCLDLSQTFDEVQFNKKIPPNLLFDGTESSSINSFFGDNVHLLDRGVEHVVEKLSEYLKTLN